MPPTGKKTGTDKTSLNYRFLRCTNRNENSFGLYLSANLHSFPKPKAREQIKSNKYITSEQTAGLWCPNN